MNVIEVNFVSKKTRMNVATKFVIAAIVTMSFLSFSQNVITTATIVALASLFLFLSFLNQISWLDKPNAEVIDLCKIRRLKEQQSSHRGINSGAA